VLLPITGRYRYRFPVWGPQTQTQTPNRTPIPHPPAREQEQGRERERGVPLPPAPRPPSTAEERGGGHTTYQIPTTSRDPTATAHFLLGRCIPSFARRSAPFGKLRRTAARHVLARPLGNRNRGRSSAIPARPSGAAPEGLDTARFSSPLELKKRRSALCPRVAALWCSSTPPKPKPPPRPAGGSHCLGYHLGRAGGRWQGPPEGPIARARR
jgi:hypothetical protein